LERERGNEKEGELKKKLERERDKNIANIKEL
jgi:hypothetical protein